MKKTIFLIALVFVCALAIPAYAAHPQKPGKWEITTEVDMPGMPMKPQPMTRTMCITKEDIEKNPENTIPKPRKRGGGEREDCKISDYKVDANTVSWNLSCAGENPVTGSGKMTYESDAFKGDTHMKMGEHEINIHMSGKYLGAECSKDEKK